MADPRVEETGRAPRHRAGAELPLLALSLIDGVGWQFRDAAGTVWRSAEVPGCVHRDLHRHALIPDPFFGRNEHAVQWVSDRTWEYRANFRVPPDLIARRHVELVADGLDTLATLVLNGHEVARSENMFAGLRCDVRRHLRPGRNEIRVRFASATRFVATHRLGHRPREINDPVGGGTRLRKEQCQFGWDWAPRLVTAGIWRDLRLEAWSGNRLKDVCVTQQHGPRGVTLAFRPELARADAGARIEGTVAQGGRVVARIVNGTATIANPLLWWPRGQGDQPLYEIDLKVSSATGELIGWWSRRMGLRTIELRQARDCWGESFQFVVNGRAIFAKGASWVPAHAFVAGLTRADYAPLVGAAAAANMNMLRVWGGGIYEHDSFYDLCDELGLLVWQDFMFACTLYPGDAAFRRSVAAEAAFQVRRLRGRTCLALWCGNNELELLNGPELARPRARAAYDAIFRQLLPKTVARYDGVTPYWRSSPSQRRDGRPGNPERSGNAHYWDVWHLRQPVQDYERKVFRFVSEFGMQSLPSPDVAATFGDAGAANLFSPAMENHQKHPQGNQILLEYISRRYRFPKDYAALAYLSQLNQAHCLQVGVEHYRRHQPRCAGTLYWQLNDCWPAASWSSLEFGGGWKALHHAARRFYAPMLVSAHVPGDETAGIGNRRRSTVRHVHLYTICDAPEGAAAQLTWEVWHLDGRVRHRGAQRVQLRPRESRRQVTVDLGPWIEQHGREQLYLRIALEREGRTVSEDTVFLCPPRFLELPRAATRILLRPSGADAWEVTFISPVFQHRLQFAFAGMTPLDVSDNWFDLYPGRPKTVTVRLPAPIGKTALARALRTCSLVDSYA